VEDVPDVMAAEGQVEQVVVNLLSNACLAIPEGRAGEVVVRLRRSPPGQARMEVSDNGVGIRPENMQRIFDPFFTTRAPGQGTGLGLSICSAIVDAHGGTLTVESEVDKGSIFRMELPTEPMPA
jgi:signal transduction histidine kinase